MWFKLSTKTLDELINKVVTVIPSRTPYPIIQNILFSTEDGKLNLLATDLDIYVKTWTEISSQKKSRVLLPGRKISGIVKESAAEEIEFTLEESRVIVKSGRSLFKIPILDPEEFPRMFEKPSATTFTVDGQGLRQIFEAVEFAVSKGEDRPAMTGVLWEIKADYSRMVATDGHRMAVSEDRADVPKIEEQSHILPTKIFSFLPKDLDEPVKVSIDEAKIGLSFGSTDVVSRLIEGPYPDYEKVIPAKIENILTVKREELSAALRRMMIFSNQVTRQIKFVLGNKNIELYSFSPEGEEAQEDLVGSYDGDNFEVAYNGAYLIDMLRHIDQEEVTFEITGALSAAVVKGSGEPGDKHRFYLVMPILLD